MNTQRASWMLRLFALTLVSMAPLSIAWGAPGTVDYVGDVITVDRTAGTIVVGDMGPLLASGTSTITPRSIQVTPSTEFATVKRAQGTAPSGWIGDYVESTLHAWEVKPGDFVTAEVRRETQGLQALKITVVDTR